MQLSRAIAALRFSIIQYVICHMLWCQHIAFSCSSWFPACMLALLNPVYAGSESIGQPHEAGKPQSWGDPWNIFANPRQLRVVEPRYCPNWQVCALHALELCGYANIHGSANIYHYAVCYVLEKWFNHMHIIGFSKALSKYPYSWSVVNPLVYQHVCLSVSSDFIIIWTQSKFLWNKKQLVSMSMLPLWHEMWPFCVCSQQHQCSHHYELFWLHWVVVVCWVIHKYICVTIHYTSPFISVIPLKQLTIWVETYCITTLLLALASVLMLKLMIWWRRPVVMLMSLCMCAMEKAHWKYR